MVVGRGEPNFTGVVADLLDVIILRGRGIWTQYSEIVARIHAYLRGSHSKKMQGHLVSRLLTAIVARNNRWVIVRNLAFCLD